MPTRPPLTTNSHSRKRSEECDKGINEAVTSGLAVLMGNEEKLSAVTLTPLALPLLPLVYSNVKREAEPPRGSKSGSNRPSPEERR